MKLAFTANSITGNSEPINKTLNETLNETHTKTLKASFAHDERQGEGGFQGPGDEEGRLAESKFPFAESKFPLLST